MTTSSSRWLCQPEVPTSEELLRPANEDYDQFANKIDGPWRSKDKYLRAHYSLLRDDAVTPIWSAVNSFRDTPDMMEEDGKGILIYEKVSRL